MRCRVCGEDATYPLWRDARRRQWRRCLACGSDTSPYTWEESRPTYDAKYLRTHAGKTPQAIQEDMRANLDWFSDYRKDAPSIDFLDVGCTEGASLRGMAARGWSVAGFDIIQEAKLASPPGDHITVAETFAANLFPQKYGAILAREVIEHVPGWRAFLEELHAAALPAGLVQIQTPRPTAAINRIGYQSAHLQLFAPYTLRYWVERLGFDVLDYRLHDEGQCWMLRRI